ncbi:hypothetical protein FDT66_07875 [Polaribacter aestuariivivens]|uniref:Uncharacterized protein n=1 Tax=Polaribacter aestuariivivens TaxID=2304626 RepID=A0A5S3N5S7_9FLAO|nr:hypothetical protein [Polaribacter aestuariivivens]TMM30670.1 hypothetical protein FDT66_07875 [Polaribacter aestuariivivens]
MRKKQIYSVVRILVIGAITLFVGSKLTKQNKRSTEFSEFIISIKNNDNKITMKCEKGCAWKQLTYTIKEENKKQTIDEYGMTEFNKNSSKKEKYLANFLIKIEKTDKGLKLNGIEGTAWIELEFSLADNRFQTIDNLGMI